MNRANYINHLSDEVREAPVPVLKSNAGSYGDAVQRIFRHVERYVDLVSEPLVEASQQGSAASEVDSVVDDVGIELRRCLLERRHDGRLDFRDALLERVGNLLV